MSTFHLPIGWALVGWEQDGRTHIVVCRNTGPIEARLIGRMHEATQLEIDLRPHEYRQVVAEDLRMALNGAFTALRRPGGLFPDT